MRLTYVPEPLVATSVTFLSKWNPDTRYQNHSHGTPHTR